MGPEERVGGVLYTQKQWRMRGRDLGKGVCFVWICVWFCIAVRIDAAWLRIWYKNSGGDGAVWVVIVAGRLLHFMVG